MAGFFYPLLDALDIIEYALVLLDKDLNVQYFNQRFRDWWLIPEHRASESYTFEELMQHGQRAGVYDIPTKDIPAYLASQLAKVKAGSQPAVYERRARGRTVKFECIALPNGGRLLTYSDESKLINALDQLEVLATTDELTQLFNRRHFYYCVQQEFDRIQRSLRPLSVIVFDIDYFKKINDQHGHPVGDEVLRKVARISRNFVRKSDVVGRLGGKEFGIALFDTPLDMAVKFAEKLRLQIASAKVDTAAGQVRVSASFGVSAVNQATTDFDLLMSRADQALYTAKREGRNRVMA